MNRPPDGAADAPRVRRPYDPDGDALTELSQWCRKHYNFEVRGGPFCQPGDESYVTLSAAGRRVCVDEWDLNTYDSDGAVERSPTLAEMIHLALRRWHEDAEPKRFHVLYEGQSSAAPPTGSGLTWSVRADGLVEAFLTAHSEAEAVATSEAELAPAGEFRLLEIWEVATPSASPPGGNHGHT